MGLIYRLTMFSLTCLSLSGCTSLPAVLEAAGKDPATVCFRVTSVYGTLQGSRTNITNGNVTCNSDGMTVTSTPQVIPIGVQVVPK